VERLTLADVVRQARTLVERARAGKATAEDLSGGTFTITNLGMYSINGFTPIINLPETAILGIGRISDLGNNTPTSMGGAVFPERQSGESSIQFRFESQEFGSGF
jgi:pyruvate dehydrogenase E2 component (dihydrolipoamide acetyltransferase)